jgi:hypothetical protein
MIYLQTITLKTGDLLSLLLPPMVPNCWQWFLGRRSGGRHDHLDSGTFRWIDGKISLCSTVWWPTSIRFSGYDLETAGSGTLQDLLVATAAGQSLDSGLFACLLIREWVDDYYFPLWKKLRNGMPPHLGMPLLHKVFGAAHRSWTLSCDAYSSGLQTR